MNKDLDELAGELEKNPEEPVWSVLARLGWVPPATAEDFRRRIHELEVRVRELEPQKLAD